MYFSRNLTQGASHTRQFRQRAGTHVWGMTGPIMKTEETAQGLRHTLLKWILFIGRTACVPMYMYVQKCV